MRTEAPWKKSTASSAGECDCVELKLSAIDVQIRDSKHAAPKLRFPATTWRTFVDKIEDPQRT